MWKQARWGLTAGLSALLWTAAQVSAQETDWGTYTSAAVRAFQQGHYTEAGTHLTAALKEAERFGSEDPRLVGTLHNLGVLYEIQGRYAEAETLLKRVLAIREKTLGANHREVVRTLNSLAEVYNAQARYAEAEPLFRKALATRQKTLGQDNSDTARSLNDLGVLLYRKGKYSEAEPLLTRALAIYEKTLGPENPETARTLNNLALLHRAKGRFAIAEPLLKRALAIHEKALGPDHPGVAKGLNDLATLYRDQGKPTEVESLYTRALAVWDKVLGRRIRTWPKDSTAWRGCISAMVDTRGPSRSFNGRWGFRKRPLVRSTRRWRRPWSDTRPCCGRQTGRWKRQGWKPAPKRSGQGAPTKFLHAEHTARGAGQGRVKGQAHVFLLNVTLPGCISRREGHYATRIVVPVSPHAEKSLARRGYCDTLA